MKYRARGASGILLPEVDGSITRQAQGTDVVIYFGYVGDFLVVNSEVLGNAVGKAQVCFCGGFEVGVIGVPKGMRLSFLT